MTRIPRHRVDAPPGLIQTGNVERRLRSAYGIKGKSVTPRLGDQLHPTVLVDDLAHPLWYDETDVRRSFYFVTEPANVANFSYATIANPLGSGTLVYLESIYVEFAGNLVEWIAGRVTGAEPANVQVGQHYDDRLGLFTTSLRLRSGNAAANQIAGPWMRQITGASPGASGWIACGAVLSPGGLPWGIQLTSINIALSCGFSWQERPLTP